MSQSAIIYPVLLQSMQSLLLLPLLGAARARSMQANKQSMADDDVRMGTNLWSDEATKISNNYKNQFEIPVLFFAVTAFALNLGQADQVMTALAWVFVLARAAHAIIHIGPNIVKWRAITFLAGVATVLAMWTLLAWRVWTGAIVN